MSSHLGQAATNRQGSIKEAPCCLVSSLAPNCHMQPASVCRCQRCNGDIQISGFPLSVFPSFCQVFSFPVQPCCQGEIISFTECFLQEVFYHLISQWGFPSCKQQSSNFIKLHVSFFLSHYLP